MSPCKIRLGFLILDIVFQILECFTKRKEKKRKKKKKKTTCIGERIINEHTGTLHT